MLFSIFYFLAAVETFLLSVYMASVGSTEEASKIFNLSVSRLTAVLFLFIIGLVFLFLAFRPIFKKDKKTHFEDRFLSKEKSLWWAFGSGILLVCLALFLLTRQLNAFGDFKLIYQRLEPVLVWLVILGAQTAYFSAVWYCARYINDDSEQTNSQLQKELLPLLGLFFVFLIFKLVFISATAYGPLGRGDEMTYYDMADSFYRGFFSAKESNHYPPLYPLSFVITLVFKAWTFEGIKLLNAIFSSGLVFPVYFIARAHLDSRKSLITAFLSCLIPYHLVFPRRILSENLFFPLFLWVMLVTYVQPKNHKYRLHWDMLNGALVAALYLTRYITLATIPFFLLAWWTKPFSGEKSLFKPGAKKILHFALICAAMLAVFSPWLLSGIRDGAPVKLLLGFGITSRTTEAQLTLQKLLAWVVLYVCYFILVGAPVLHLLIASFWQVDFQNWRIGFGRWIFQVLALMSGFFMAVTRHSWRAYYNADLPAAIMGRYLIVFSVIYFIISVIVAQKFKLERFRSTWNYLLFTQLLPFVLVTFAYFTLIKGVIIQTDGDLLKSLGSVDGFFTEILGPLFFVLLFLIYGITNWLLIKGSKKLALTALVIGLVIYYGAGVPDYYRNLMDYQTYPWLAKQISRMLPPPDPKSGEAERITVFMPEERTTKSGAEIYNGLRTHGFTQSIIEVYSESAVSNMETDKGFIIVRLEDDFETQELTVYEINEMKFQIIPIEK